MRTGPLAGPGGNAFVPVKQRKREFEDENTVTMPDLPWFGEVTVFLISKRDTRPRGRACRKSLGINGKTRNAGRFLSRRWLSTGV
jgi:hypothetical protein